MISVRSSIDELERASLDQVRNERVAKLAMGGWLAALRSMQDTILPLFATAAKPVKDEWESICKQLRPTASEELLRNSPAAVGLLVEQFGQGVRRIQEEDVVAVRNILSVLAAAADGLRDHTDTFGGEFRQLGESLGRLAQVDHPDEMRQRLQEECASLRDIVERMSEQAAAAEAGMRDDLMVFQRRLAEAELAAATDALTGLANRRALERQIELRIQNHIPFCVLLFDLDEFKSINDRFGHDCGDQALRLFAGILKDQVRPGDVVARWGGDEFLAVLDCQLKDALRRSQQIAVKLSNRYPLTYDGGTVAVPITASVGVAEHQRGESAIALLRRADKAMYAAKPRSVRGEAR